MKRNIVLCAIFCCVLLVCAACGKEASINNNLKVSEKIVVEEKPYQIPDTYKKEAENVIFNTEIIVNPKVLEEGLYYTTATLQELDYDKAYEVLIKDKESAEMEEYEMDDGKYVSYQNNYETEELTPSCLFYSTDKFQYYYHAFSVAADDYNANLYSTESELDFANKEEVLQEIKSKLEPIGFNMEGTYNCYSLDYQTLQKEEYAIGNNGKEDSSMYKTDWSEADNGYYFIAHQQVQNCTVQYPVAEIFPKVSEENAPIKILYTNNGMQAVEIDEVFNFQVSKDYINLIPFEEIVNHIAEKYQMLLTESTYEVTKAELYMRPMKKNKGIYDVIPTWQITIIENSTGSESLTYINAITGEEII